MEHAPSIRALIDAYTEGAWEGGALVKEIRISNLIFNINKQFGHIPPEPDLEHAIEKIAWANHIVLFTPVSLEAIPSKIKGFFDRIFMPDEVFRRQQPFNNNFTGKTARIVSILDEQAWRDWKQTQRSTYHTIKRKVLENSGIKPVHTCTIGHLESLENPYSKKWIKKLFVFGEKLI